MIAAPVSNLSRLHRRFAGTSAASRVPWMPQVIGNSPAVDAVLCKEVRFTLVKASFAMIQGIKF